MYEVNFRSNCYMFVEYLKSSPTSWKKKKYSEILFIKPKYGKLNFINFKVA